MARRIEHRGANRGLSGLLVGFWALLPAGCIDDDGLGPIDEQLERDPSEGASGAGALDDLTATAPTAAASSACLEEPTIGNCCTTELLTQGTELGDTDILAAGQAHCVFGWGGDDDYFAAEEDDIMVGGAGGDSLDAAEGDDTLFGEAGNDSLMGGPGADTLLGGVGADQLWGQDDDDRISGGDDADTIHGGDGYDLIHPGKGSDVVFGDAGDDVIVIYDPCELGTGELIDGGDGYDIVVSPVPKGELLALGVSLQAVEQIVVDTTHGHLAECGPPPPVVDDGFATSLTMRQEIDLGCARRMPGQYSSECDGAAGWSVTSSRNWIDVPETTTKFLAKHDGSTAAIAFHAHEVGNQSANNKNARSPVFVRALVDGVPVEPGEVRLAFSGTHDPATFTFVASDVSAGIHNVRFQWRIEDDWFFAPEEPEAELHGATVSVIVDSTHTEVAAVAVTPTEPSSFLTEDWSPIEDPTTEGPLTVMAYVTEGATTTVTFGAEVNATNFGTLELRAKVDDSTQALPIDTVRLAQRFPAPYHGTFHPSGAATYGRAVRSFTFAAEGLSEGWHKFTFEGRLVIAGSEAYPGELEDAGIHAASMGARSAAVVSMIDDPAAGVATAIAAVDSTFLGVPEDFTALYGLSETVDVPQDSQVIIRLDMDIRDPWNVETRLLMDGDPVPMTERDMTLSPVHSSGTISVDHVLKRLPAGSHTFSFEWRGNDTIPQADLRGRMMTVRVEPLHAPDLGRGPDMGAGSNGETFNRMSIQAFDGVRKVLPVIIDPQRPEVKRLSFASDVPGTYAVTVEGQLFSYATGAGEGVAEVVDALVADINAANIGVTALEVTGDLFCISGCVDELMLVADQLGASMFTAWITQDPGGVMSLSTLSNAPLPSNTTTDHMLFGSGGNADAADAYWLQQSRGLVQLEPAYVEGTVTGGTRVVGPVQPGLSGYDAVMEYWQRTYTESCDPMNAATFPWRGGHQRRYWEGLRNAADDPNIDLDFSTFDVDGDGVVRSDELMLLVITPQASNSGTRRDLQPFCLDGGEPVEPMELDGVRLELTFLEWYSNNGATGYQDHALVSHEIGHYFGMDDMYLNVDIDDDGSVDLGCRKGECTEHEAWAKSIMDATRDNALSSNHWSELDGFHKLALGWVTPRTIRTSTAVSLEPVTSGREVLVLPRAGSGGREYFLIENRVNRPAIDGGYDVEIGIADDGLAIWHIIEPEHAEYWELDGGSPSLGCWEGTPNANTCGLMGSGHQCTAMDFPAMDFTDSTESFVRRGIRLVRPGVTAFSNGSLALWSSATGDALDQGPFCGPGILTWSDGTPSGYELMALSMPGNTMTMCVQVDGQPCI